MKKIPMRITQTVHRTLLNRSYWCVIDYIFELWRGMTAEESRARPWYSTNMKCPMPSFILQSLQLLDLIVTAPRNASMHLEAGPDLLFPR